MGFRSPIPNLLARFSGGVQAPPASVASTARKPLTVLDASGTLMGFCLADARWTQRLSGAYDLDCTIPREYLLSDGSKVSKLALIAQGWYLDFQGYRYVVDDVRNDPEQGMSVQASDAAWRDLSNYFASYSPGPSSFLNRTPTYIGNALLSGRKSVSVRNAGFGILDKDGLPTNWTHPEARWVSQLVADRRVWGCSGAGGGTSVSDDIRCVPGIAYQVSADMMQPSTSTGAARLRIQWILADGSTVNSDPTDLQVGDRDGQFHTVTTPPLVALGPNMRIYLTTNGTDQEAWFDDVRLFEIGPAPGWTYQAGEGIDTREGVVPYSDGALQKHGVWNDSGTYLEGSTTGDYVGLIINGSIVGVAFAAGGVGAQAKIRVNGVQYQQQGTTLVRGTDPIDVASAKGLTLRGLDPANDHMVEVEVLTGPVRVFAFSQSTENPVSMTWDTATTAYEALAALQKAVGGELWFDPINKVAHHETQRGRDLKAENICEFFRATEQPNSVSANIIRMVPTEDRSEIVNEVVGLGYGEGEYQLMVTVSATDVHPVTGKTSQQMYGVCRGKYVNKECKSAAALIEECKQALKETQWASVGYDVQVLDETAALLIPGDTGHFVYPDLGVNETLRILEIARSTDGSPATLTVGNVTKDLADLITPLGKELSTLQRAYQGAPILTNSNFSGQFERTGAGTDVPADCLFYVPYGADLRELRLRHRVSGMRSFATGAAQVGVATSSAATTPSGGGTTPTSSSNQQAVTVSSGVSRSNTTASFGSIIAPGLSATEYPTQLARATVFNAQGVLCTFDWEFRRNSPSGALVVSGSAEVPANGILGFNWDWSSYQGNNVCFRVQPTSSTPSLIYHVVLTGYAAHQHTVQVPAHTHAAHSHTVPAHEHALVFGIRESEVPGTLRVYLDDVLIPDLNDRLDVDDFDLLPYIGLDSNGRVHEGFHTLSYRSASPGATGSVAGLLFLKQFVREG
jgi:hypothetical protein